MLGTQGQPLARVKPENWESYNVHVILFGLGVAHRGANKIPRPGNKMIRAYSMYDYEMADLSLLK